MSRPWALESDGEIAHCHNVHTGRRKTGLGIAYPFGGATPMVGVTKTTISAVAVVVGWAAVVANAFHMLGKPLPIEQLNTALSALIVGSLLVGLVLILRGPGYFKAMRLGEAVAVAREQDRRRAAQSTSKPGTRVEAVTG